MNALISGIIVIVSLIAGFGAKVYFGEVSGEKSQDMIERVVESTTGIDLEPIFDLDNEEGK